MASDPPQWPESTKRLSQLRVTIEFRSAQALRRFFGVSRLNLDVVDYPGEWLIDLPLLEESYQVLVGGCGWSARARGTHMAPPRRGSNS